MNGWSLSVLFACLCICDCVFGCVRLDLINRFVVCLCGRSFARLFVCLFG